MITGNIAGYEPADNNEPGEDKGGVIERLPVFSESDNQDPCIDDGHITEKNYHPS